MDERLTEHSPAIRKRLKGNQINWNQVFYFSEVAASGSLKAASAKLDLSPSTLSEHVAQLEEDLRTQLFYRQHRKLVLTPEGTKLYLRAKEMFEAGQRLIDVVSPVPLGCYPVSIGMVPSPSLQQAYPIVGRYVDEFGPIGMKLIHSNHSALESGLARSDFDFGFTDQKPERKDITSRIVSSSAIRFYVSARHHREKTFNDLVSSLPVLICSAEPNVRSVAEQALIDADFPPTAVIASDYPSSLIDLCEQGLGIGVFSEGTFLGREEAKFRALRMPKDAPRLQGTLYVMWSRDAENTEAIRHLVQILEVEGGRFGTA